MPGQDPRLAVVTGSSRGLGQALARELLYQQYEVLGIARTGNPGLAEFARSRGGVYRELLLDLSVLPEGSNLWRDWLKGLKGRRLSQLCLINNAGMLSPVRQLHDADPVMLSHNISVNLTAPLILSSLFIKASRDLSPDRRIVNISSGAGRKPYSGWSAYCAAKAGLDHLTRVIQAEAVAAGDSSLSAVSLAPGILDTTMQAEIRSTSRADFPDLDRFLGYFSGGELADPADTAQLIVRHFLVSRDYQPGDILDIRDFQ